MNRILIFLWLSLCCCIVWAKNNKEKVNYTIPVYEVKCAGVGIEGTYFLYVSIEQGKPNENVKFNISKAAIHGVIFKGVGTTKECAGQKPIVSEADAEYKNQDFFQELFSDFSMVCRYATLVEGSIKVTKKGKRKYCISSLVSVKKDTLRKLLESQNVIEGFNDLF